MQAANRLSTATDWIDTRSAVGGLMGQQSFTAGVMTGMAKNLVTGLVELAWMLKMFALAEYHDSQHSAGFRGQLRRASMHVASPGMSMLTMTAAAFWPGFDNKAREAFEEREALITAVIYAFEHPGEVFDNIVEEQKKRFEQFKTYKARHALSGEFQAGMLMGELLLDLLAIPSGIAGITKIATKVPGLLKLLPRLQKTIPALRTASKIGKPSGAAGKAAGKLGGPAPDAKKPAASSAKAEAGSKGPAVKEQAKPVEKPEGKAKKDCACALAGKPVDAITGCKVLFGPDELDFALPAPLALPWQRTYSSDNPLAGPLGQGWSLPISSALEFAASSITLHDSMHRGITFPLLKPGESFYSRHEQITLIRIDTSSYELRDEDGVRDQFRLLAPDARVARLVGKADRNSNHIGIEYDARQLPVRINDSAGRTFVLAFDERDRLTGVAELRAVGSAEAAGGGDRPAQVAVPLVSYEYDAAGDLVRVRNRLGQATREFAYRNHIMVSHAQPGGLVSQYQYSEYTPLGRVLRNHTNTGQEWQFTYAMRQTMVTDNLGRQVFYKFDGERRYTGMTDAMGGAERRERDSYGKLIALTDPSGRTERYQYDTRSRLTRIEAVDGALTKIGYDTDCDKPATITDALGATTCLRYDSRANLISITDALQQRTEYRYDHRGLPVEMIDARGGIKRMAYNVAGQLTTYTDCSGQSTHFEYDLDGNLTQVTDALGKCSGYRYDGAGKLVSASYPDGSSETYEYDALGRLVGHTDAAGQKTTYVLDPEGRLLTRTNALGGKLEYGYDDAKRLAQLINENGAAYAFRYDALDRLEQETGFDNITTRYVYDKVGRPLAKIELGQTGGAQSDAAGPPAFDKPGRSCAIETAYVRDAAGRLIEKTVTGGTAEQRAAGPLSTRYRYDTIGRLTEAINHDSTVTLAYDAIGQLVEERSDARSTSSTLRHAYDALGNRIQTVLPDGRKLNQLFYGSGHLHQINIDGDVVSDIERDAKHREISRTQGALTSVFEHDPVGRLTAQMARLDPARAGANLAQQRAALHEDDADMADGCSLIARQYRYDRAGNLIAIDDQRAGTTTYRYDAIGRILSAVQPQLTETFAFDPAHNLLDPAAAETSGGAGRLENNQLTVFEDKRYAYDSHGNLVDKKVARHTQMTLAWNAAHQLTHANVTRNAQHDTPTVQHTEYGYDPFGRRIFKRDAFGETRFTWDGNRLLAEMRGSHTRTYLYNGASFVPLAQVDSSGSAPIPENDSAGHHSNVLYFHTDHLGTPRELTDTEGDLQWTATYKAWGNVVQVESPKAYPVEQAQALRFQGQYFDVETGLHYNRFRYYDPEIGRFVSQDPIGLKGGHNLYQYAPNPSGWTDPLGLATLEHATDFDKARKAAFEKAGMTNPDAIEFSKVDPVTGTVVEFKGPGGAKVAYDAPHADMDTAVGHDQPHVGWQEAGKRSSGGAQRGNITYDGQQHPHRPDVKAACPC